jgi:hypothetical protein
MRSTIICTVHQILWWPVKKSDVYRAGVGEIRNVYKNLVKKLEGRTPLER